MGEQPVLNEETRREYIHVGLEKTSLFSTVSSFNTGYSP
jgi:hypothetical protein